MKGFSLNFAASKKIDFSKIKNIVCNINQKLSIPIKQSTIIRDKKDWSLHTKNSDKIYRLVYDKRIVLDDLTTIPFGYKI